MQVSRFVLVAVSSFIAASAAFAQGDAGATPPKPRGGIPTFNFDLRTLEADPLLPFDQIFNVRAKVNAEVTAGKLQFRPKSDEACAFLETEPELKKTIPGRRVKRPNNDVELLFAVPMLKPNVDYCFAFRTERDLTTDEVKAFREKARDLIDRATLTEGLSDIAADQRKAVRNQIAADMKKLGEDENAEINEGTTFGKNPTREAEQDFNTVLQDISQANGSRTLGIKNYCRNQETADKTVTQLMQAGAPARTLLESVASAAKDSDNRALAKLMTAEAAEVVDAVLAKKEYQQVLDRGCDTVEAFKDPTEADALQHDLERVRGQFEDLKALIEELAADDAAAKGAGLTTKEEKAAALSVAKEFERAAEEIDHARSSMRNLGDTLEKREAALDAAADEVKQHVQDDVTILATSTPDFVTRHGFYATMDVGVATAWEIDEVASYIGMNFYTRPINKAAPLRHGEEDWFRKRFSVTLGLTTQALTKAGAYKGVLSDRALVGAVGWRVLDSVKLTTGGFLLKENDRNPLVDKTHLAVTPFVAISIDWDVRNTLKDVGSVFGIP